MKGFVHRDNLRSGNSGWDGPNWVAYGECGSALCDEKGDVVLFGSEADAETALRIGRLKTVRQYLAAKRQKGQP